MTQLKHGIWTTYEITILMERIYRVISNTTMLRLAWKTLNVPRHTTTNFTNFVYMQIGYDMIYGLLDGTLKQERMTSLCFDAVELFLNTYEDIPESKRTASTIAELL